MQVLRCSYEAVNIRNVVAAGITPKMWVLTLNIQSCAVVALAISLVMAKHAYLRKAKIRKKINIYERKPIISPLPSNCDRYATARPIE